MRLAISAVASHRRELLPRVFTLAVQSHPCLRRFVFCGACYNCWVSRCSLFPLGSMVARAARTFLPALLPGDRIVLAIFPIAKIRTFLQTQYKKNTCILLCNASV